MKGGAEQAEETAEQLKQESDTVVEGEVASKEQDRA